MITRYWEHPELTHVNRLPGRSPLFSYRSEADALSDKRARKLDLNGNWDFRYFGKPEDVPVSINQPTAKGKWDTVQVPGNWTLQGYGHPHYMTLIRELILQMKEGHISAQPFQEKFGVNVLEEFRQAFSNQEAAGYLKIDGDEVRLTRKGLLQVDSLLPEYFEPEHRQVRYT